MGEEKGGVKECDGAIEKTVQRIPPLEQGK